MVEDDSLFKVFDLGGEKVFGTASTLSNIHSHYMNSSSGIDTASGYEYTGRMMMNDARSGIGVTFFSQYPSEDKYYRLRRYNNKSFHISPHGTRVVGDMDTDVIPVADLWYWFKVQVEDKNGRTEIRAKIWAEGTTEPIGWQVDCYDESSSRLIAGVIGLWSYNSGAKFWDDLSVEFIFP